FSPSPVQCNAEGTLIYNKNYPSLFTKLAAGKSDLFKISIYPCPYYYALHRPIFSGERIILGDFCCCRCAYRYRWRGRRRWLRIRTTACSDQSKKAYDQNKKHRSI